MTAYGADFDCLEDIDTALSDAPDDVTALVQAIYRRLTTRRGKLWYAPTYGIDVHDYVLDTASVGQMTIEIQTEIEKDERVKRCRATLVQNGARVAGTIAVSGIAGQSFTLTLSIDRVTGALLLGRI